MDLMTNPAPPNDSTPLCVDLDGTLINTDMLWESLVRWLRRKPWYLPLILLWWSRGRARLKAELAARVRVDPATLPYHQPFLRFLQGEKRCGRTLLLVTASDEALARPVAEYTGLFEEVLASDGKTNLRGKTKGSRLAERFGKGGFDYAGNSSVDLPVWALARQAIVVNGSLRLVARAGQVAKLGPVFPRH